MFVYFVTFFQWIDDKTYSLEKTMTGLDKNSVRRIGRNIGATQYKDTKVEMYDTDDWESFGKSMKKKKMSKSHKEALQEGARKAREAEAKKKG